MNSSSVRAGARIHIEDQRQLSDNADLSEVFEGVVGELSKQRHIGCVRPVAAHQQGVPIGARCLNCLRADDPRSAAAIFNHERLPQPAGELVCEQAGDEVCSPAGRKRHHHLDRLLGPGLGGDRRNQRERGECCCNELLV